MLGQVSKVQTTAYQTMSGLGALTLQSYPTYILVRCAGLCHLLTQAERLVDIWGRVGHHCSYVLLVSLL